VGLWIVGARGAVGSCVALGVCGLKHQRFSNVGLVTARDSFKTVPLADPGSFVLGGAEVRDGSIVAAALAMAAEGLFEPADVEAVRAELVAIDARISPGFLDSPDGAEQAGAGLYQQSLDARDWKPARAVESIRGRIQQFRDSNNLECVVVVNLASTEVARPAPESWDSLAAFERDLAAGAAIPISSLYAYAAMSLGCPYINFTPSLGAKPGAFEELARKHNVPHAGCDGKTGETLVKTVLAPLFRDRNLEVLAWQGYNLLGNGDGRTLADPAHRAGKIANKDKALRELLGDRAEMHTKVSIDYVPSLGDWKTAWDFIHFRGFFGTRMSLQFTWSGSDSALAAPLVLDLARLADLAQRRGESGAMAQAAAFFKSPIGCKENDFHRQNAALEDYARAASE
jgi:myo-inositol-1-phosphate synthase